MHMLLTSLPVIYQGRVPILQYGQRHVDQLSRAHLRYVLTDGIVPWLDKLITYISDPQNNEDPEPYIKSYNAGCTELSEQEIVRKNSKRRKTRHIVQETPPTHHTHQNNNPDTNAGCLIKGSPLDYPDLADPQKHNTSNKTLSTPYLAETTHPPPQPYKLRPKRLQKAPNKNK